MRGHYRKVPPTRHLSLRRIGGFSRRVVGSWVVRVAVLAGASLLTACQPAIGSECDVSVDCTGTESNRICATSLPGGYCTVFNCEPGGCPDEAVCVAFRTQPSAVPECRGEAVGTRLQRTFCMKWCDSTDDCRGGYTCASVADVENPWAARVVDGSGARREICIPPFEATVPGIGETQGFAGAPNACNPAAAPTVPPATTVPSLNQAGSAGAGGAAGR